MAEAEARLRAKIGGLERELEERLAAYHDARDRLEGARAELKALIAERTAARPIIEWASREFAWTAEIEHVLANTFGISGGFRQLQREAINATLSGRDAMVLMPTGGGKSLVRVAAPSQVPPPLPKRRHLSSSGPLCACVLPSCVPQIYQLPAILDSVRIPGCTTVVVSPLVALMLDQVQPRPFLVPSSALELCCCASWWSKRASPWRALRLAPLIRTSRHACAGSPPSAGRAAAAARRERGFAHAADACR